MTILLAGCGFQLRGAAPMGLKTLHAQADVPSQVLIDMRRLLVNTETRLTRTPAEAEMQVRILTESREKNIFTITGAGRVFEYELRLLVTYQVNAAGREEPVVPAAQIDVRRTITYSESAPLAKEAEEQLLFRDMVQDAARQILRRIAIVHRPA